MHNKLNNFVAMKTLNIEKNFFIVAFSCIKVINSVIIVIVKEQLGSITCIPKCIPDQIALKSVQ